MDMPESMVFVKPQEIKPSQTLPVHQIQFLLMENVFVIQDIRKSMGFVFKPANVEPTVMIMALASVFVTQDTINQMELALLVLHAHHQAQETIKENVSVILD